MAKAPGWIFSLCLKASTSLTRTRFFSGFHRLAWAIVQAQPLRFIFKSVDAVILPRDPQMSASRFHFFLTPLEMRVTVLAETNIAPLVRKLNFWKRWTRTERILLLFPFEQQKLQEWEERSGRTSRLVFQLRELLRMEKFRQFPSRPFHVAQARHALASDVKLQELVSNIQADFKIDLSLPEISEPVRFHSGWLRGNFSNEKTEGVCVLPLTSEQMLFIAAVVPGAIHAPTEMLRLIDVIKKKEPVFALAQAVAAMDVIFERALERAHYRQPIALKSSAAAAPFCRAPFDNARITCEGDVFVCCYLRKEAHGNVFQESFAEIWNGPKLTGMRADINEGKLPPICQTARGCPYLVLPTPPASANLSPRYPSVIELELPNTHCNIGGFTPSEKTPACIMCERSMPDFQPHQKNHLLEAIQRLRNVLPYVERINIQGVAEAMWHDWFFKILDEVQFDDFSNRVAASTITNGIVFDKSRQKRLLQRCPNSMVVFSLDAATAETYRKIRRLDAFDRVMENLKSFSEERWKSGNCRLRIQNNINLLNLHEVEAMVRTAADCMVDEIEFNPTYGYPEEILVNRENAHLFHAAQKKIEREAARLGVRATFTRPLALTY